MVRNLLTFIIGVTLIVSILALDKVNREVGELQQHVIYLNKKFEQNQSELETAKQEMIQLQLRQNVSEDMSERIAEAQGWK